MRVVEYCTQEVVHAPPTTSAEEAAQMMREQHVGCVVVVEEHFDTLRPVGIVTDRDLVVEVMAAKARPESVTLGDLQTAALETVAADDDLLDAVAQMQTSGVRRLPVVGSNGELLGLLSLDDVLPALRDLIVALCDVMPQEVSIEVRQRA